MSYHRVLYRNYLISIAVLTLSSATQSSAQVPPPPIPDSQTGLLGDLKGAYAAKNIAAYTRLLSTDVVVSIDGRIVARKRQEWIKLFGDKLATPGVFFEIKQSYSSSGTMLNVEYFNSSESFANKTRDCCWRYDAVQYTIKSGKISTIRILTGGDQEEQQKP